jgi:hypothetical protein
MVQRFQNEGSRRFVATDELADHIDFGIRDERSGIVAYGNAIKRVIGQQGRVQFRHVGQTHFRAGLVRDNALMGQERLDDASANGARSNYAYLYGHFKSFLKSNLPCITQKIARSSSRWAGVNFSFARATLAVTWAGSRKGHVL